jgi:hypothetical protein
VNPSEQLKCRTNELSLQNGSKRDESGDTLIEVVNTLHSGNAIGNEDVHLIVFYTGEEGQQTTVLKKQTTLLNSLRKEAKSWVGIICTL